MTKRTSDQNGQKNTLILIGAQKNTLASASLNGAGNVVVLETISYLLKVVKSEEYQWVEFNLQKINCVS
jgi:hypothetical protein